MNSYSFRSDHQERRQAMLAIFSPPRLMAQFLLFLGAVYLLTGCVGPRAVSNDSGFDITALETALQDEGVFVMPRDGFNPAVPADESSRLILNSSEVLNVFEFTTAGKATEQARIISGTYAGNEVYLKDRIVAVRQGPGDTGLSATLRSILGEAL